MGERGVSGEDLMEERDLRPYVIYRCVIGSRAYGLDDEESDTDRRGIYLPPAELHWSLYGVPERLEDPGEEECYWEVAEVSRIGAESQSEHAGVFVIAVGGVRGRDRAGTARDEVGVSCRSWCTKRFNGYVLSQFKKLQGDLRNRGEVKWRHVIHLL